MSPDIAGLVQTSTNLAMIDDPGRRGGGEPQPALLHRRLQARPGADRIAAISRLAGFEATHTGGYPGWKPEPKASPRASWSTASTERLFGKPMAIKAIHAGLECGLIGEKYPEMEMVSIGPTCGTSTPPTST